MSGVQLYNLDIPYNVKNVIYDFNKNMYGVINDGLEGGYRFFSEALPEVQMSPGAVVQRKSQR